MSALIDRYDTALFDLDGVVYLGPHPVPGAVAALAALRERGTSVMFVTNNAARPAQVVIDHLLSLGIHADVDSVLTSAQVAVSALKSAWPAGSRALVAGSPNLIELLRETGFEIVADADARPDFVVQGYEPDLNWRQLDEATLAIQRGAAWYATNGDASRPTERGLVPGVGGAIAVIATALGTQPTVFGKPHRPMLDEAVRRTGAASAIFVGDRLDTDIFGAHVSGLDSLLVFSGAHGKKDLITAPPQWHPGCIGSDVGALLRPRRVAETYGSHATCGAQSAHDDGKRIVVASDPTTMDEQLDALWAVAQLAWAAPESDPSPALGVLDLLP